MEGIFACEERDALAALAGDWNRLAAIEPLYTPMFSDLDEIAASPEVRVCLAGRRSGGVVTHLAVFVTATVPRGYWLGPKRLFTMSLRATRLFGNTMLGNPDEDIALALLRAGTGPQRPDMLMLDDLPEPGALITLAGSHRLDGPTRVSRHNTARRLIDLSGSMDRYWAALRPTTAKAARRDLRLFERLRPEFRYYSGHDAIALFLPLAAGIGKLSYQAGLGFGVRDDAGTRARFARLADEGRLRCYLALVDGKPAAYVWGDVGHATFYFRMTGYDPAFAAASPGKAMLFEVVRDLIETSGAAVFDFGIRDVPYKERLSTRSVGTVHLLVGYTARGRLALTLDRILDKAKQMIPRLLDTERIARLRRRLRA